jgi:hypothetical protein
MIFDNEYVKALCAQYRRNNDFVTYRKICEATSNLMDTVIRANKFHMSAPFDDIKNHLFLQLKNWINGVGLEPGAPKVFTYFSTCIKHGALSYVTKEKNLRSRMVYTDVPSEAFPNAPVYHQNFDFELREHLRDALRSIEVRWAEPVIKEIVRYYVHTIVHDRAAIRRMQVLRTAVMAYSVDMETARFLLDWTQAAIRMTLLEQYEQPLGEIDIIRASEKFSFIPDIINAVGLPAAKKLMSVFAGMSVKFPSQAQLRKHIVYRQIHDAMEQDCTPATISNLAGTLRTSVEKIEQYREEMLQNIGDGLLNDEPLYGSEDATPIDDLVGDDK